VKGKGASGKCDRCGAKLPASFETCSNEACRRDLCLECTTACAYCEEPCCTVCLNPKKNPSRSCAECLEIDEAIEGSGNSGMGSARDDSEE